MSMGKFQVTSLLFFLIYIFFYPLWGVRLDDITVWVGALQSNSMTYSCTSAVVHEGLMHANKLGLCLFL